MALAAPWIADKLAAPDDVAEVSNAFYWMAAAMPAIVLTSGYRGILEAMGRFGVVNLIRFPMGVFTFAGPLAVIWTGHTSLDLITAVLGVGRVVACAVHGLFALRAVPGLIGHGRVDQALLRPLLGMGGWLSVSNIVAPLMNYIDRFMLGFLVSATAVAFYATPQELILRIGIIPGALAAVLFPLFAASSADAEQARNAGLYVRRYSLLIFVIMLPITIGLLIFAHPVLALWISPDFAQEAALTLQIMAVAALASGLAQVPYTMLQGQGRADITGKLHLAEFPLYVALLYLLVLHYGAVGAAWAWLLRIVVDLLALYWLCSQQLTTRQIIGATR
ncbi:MAG: oligosaccharide flippase family protein [Sphingopyxis sp.]|nr:oligosaccharide flippase family protein [Sphingopyxis sp.]